MDRFSVTARSAYTTEPDADYFETNCVDDPVKMCDFYRNEGRILKTVDAVHQVRKTIRVSKKMMMRKIQLASRRLPRVPPFLLLISVYRKVTLCIITRVQYRGSRLLLLHATISRNKSLIKDEAFTALELEFMFFIKSEDTMMMLRIYD